MHDIKVIRADVDKYRRAMERRGIYGVENIVLQLDLERRALLADQQKMLTERNELAKKIGLAKRRGEDTEQEEAAGAHLRAVTDASLRATADVESQLRAELERLPNVLDADVPDGADESANIELKRWGAPPAFTFTPKQHFELGEALGMMDFERAARMAGSRFTILRGPLARLERALGQFMLDLHTQEHGYEEVSVPSLVNDAAAFGTNQLPKFAEDLFRTTDGRWLIPTAELPLTNMAAGEILPEAALPLRLTALTDCFRSEAGASGRDTRGMLRQHQFRKVELVTIAHPDRSDAEHERMTSCAESVLERLNLPYRRMLLCTGDTGFGAAKTYDLEVWLPGQTMWREISSCSNTRAFQARRMNARFRTTDGKAVAPVDTLNGSGVAVGRALIAVMENYQQADGSIAIPEVLRTRMGIERIRTPA